MTVNSQDDIHGLLAAGRAVRAAFTQMKAATKPGISTIELDNIGRAELERVGAKSAPEHYYDFPGATCISVNEEAAHGIPGKRVLEEGDLINIDVSAVLNGYVADMGESFVVGVGSNAQQRICAAVKTAVEIAMTKVRAGAQLNVIGKAVQAYAEGAGFEIVRNLGSHGVGRSIHEEPSYVPIDNPGDKRRLHEGMVLTIEPFFTSGTRWVREQKDGWTLSVPMGTLVAQFEQTLIVQSNASPIVVTAAGA